MIVLPYFEERFEARLPQALPDVAGRVLFNRFGPGVESLVAELKRRGVPFVILEKDLAITRRICD